MKVLFVHEVDYLAKPIYEFHEFPEGLASLGHEVGVLHFPELSKHSNIARFPSRVASVAGRVWPGVKIKLFTPRTLSGSMLGRLAFAASSFWQIKSVLKSFRPDVVVCFAVPTNGWQAMLAAKFLGKPFVFRALDVSHKIRPGWFSPLVKRAERFIYRGSTTISANNARMLRYCRELAGIEVNGAVHLPPLNLDSFAGGNRQVGRKILGLPPESRVVLYLGSFFHFSGLDRCIEEMSRHENNTIFVLIGGGQQTQQLIDLAQTRGIPNRVMVTGFLPFNELPNLVAAADVAINPMIKSLVSDCALPHKVLQYMASGIPVVSSPLDGLQATLGEDSGVTYKDSPESVMTAAMDIASSPSLQERIRETQLKRLHEVFDRDPVMMFEKFLQRLDKA